MQKRKLSKLEAYGLVAVILAAAFYGYLTRVYDPARKALEVVENEKRAAQSVIDSWGGVPPSTAEAAGNVAALETKIAVLQEELEKIKGTAKADADPAVTIAMALFDRLATKNALSVKQLTFDGRIYELGQEPPEETVARRRRQEEQRRAERDPTVKDRFGWQEYTFVVSGSQSGLVSFMGDLAKAVWLVRVNELRVDIVPKEGQDKDVTAEEDVGEYDLLLRLIL